MNNKLNLLSKYSSLSTVPEGKEKLRTEMFNFFLGLIAEEKDKFSKNLIGIFGVFSPREYETVETLHIITINKNETYFGALSELKSILGDFYMEYNIIPNVVSLPSTFINTPKDVSEKYLKWIEQRGVLLYGS